MNYFPGSDSSHPQKKNQQEVTKNSPNDQPLLIWGNPQKLHYGFTVLRVLCWGNPGNRGWSFKAKFRMYIYIYIHIYIYVYRVLYLWFLSDLKQQLFQKKDMCCFFLPHTYTWSPMLIIFFFGGMSETVVFTRWWQLKNFHFHPDPWGFMIQFDEHIFPDGLVQPPPTPLKINILHTIIKVWFRSFSFLNWWFVGSSR